MKADDLVYAHRGQRFRLAIPRGVSLVPGETVYIRLADKPYAWNMPATVVDVHGAFATIEPAAAVQRPEAWHLVPIDSETAPIVPSIAETVSPIGDSVPQFDLFGAFA